MRFDILFIASFNIFLKQADLPVISDAMMLIWRHSKYYKPIVSYSLPIEENFADDFQPRFPERNFAEVRANLVASCHRFP